MLTRLEQSEPSNRLVRLWDKVMSRAQSAGGLLGGVAQRRGRRGGRSNGAAVCAQEEAELAQAARRTAGRDAIVRNRCGGPGYPSRHDGEATAGDTGGARPDRARGAAARARTDLREGLCRAQLRLSARARMPEAVAAGGRTAQARATYWVVDAGPQELLRHDPARAADGGGQAAGGRRAGAGAGGQGFSKPG